MKIDYYDQVKDWMIPLINDGPNTIMDVGCASGKLGKLLLQCGKACSMHGIEMFEPAAATALETYETVHVGDLENMQLVYDGAFDYVICGDILEHLKDPYRILRELRRWLKPGGRILVCLPNIRNYRILRDLIFNGRWEYTSAGIMDRTHLRFFTRRSLVAMVEDAGFEVCHSRMIVEGFKKTTFNLISLGVFDEFLASQTFCLAQRPKSDLSDACL